MTLPNSQPIPDPLMEQPGFAVPAALEAELDEVRKEVEKATNIDVEKEFKNTIDPTGSLEEQLKPPELPTLEEHSPAAPPAAPETSQPAADAAPPAPSPAPAETAPEPAPAHGDGPGPSKSASGG